MKKMKLIGEGGIYNGMEQGETNEVEVKRECRIHITQPKNQIVEIKIIKGEKVIRELKADGEKWIKLIGKGKYKVRVINSRRKDEKVGISIFENN